MISAQTTEQAGGLGGFFSQYGLLIVLVVLLVFMLWSSNRRRQKMKVEQEQRARQTVPGAEVLLQGGLYGTIVEYDPENLDQPAIVELAPGIEIKVHSQAILHVVNPAEGVVTEDEFLEAEASQAGYAEGVADGEITSLSDDQRAAHAEAADVAEASNPVDDAEPGAKPQA